MKIGIPKERKTNELRVVLTPGDARRITTLGHQIFIEKDAGKACGFVDTAYSEAGCKILPSLSDVWEKSDLIIKVKEPHESEYEFMNDEKVIFSFLHPAASRELTQELIRSKILAIDFDLVRANDGSLPILAPMSAIAGTLSVHIGAQYLYSHSGGDGLLFGSNLSGIKAPQVLILGCGVAGTSALHVAYQLGAEISALDLNSDRLNNLKKQFTEISTFTSSQETISELVPKSDLIIGAALVPGAKAPKLLDENSISICKRGSVLVDIAIDQGGIATTSKAMSVENPSYKVGPLTHVCIPNMPSMVARSASQALSSAVTPWLMKLILALEENTLHTTPGISDALVCEHGILRNKHIADAFGFSFK